MQKLRHRFHHCQQHWSIFRDERRYGQENQKAFFISPIVNMEQLITDMMTNAQITERELLEKTEIKTPYGDTISWEYLNYVRNHPVKWNIPTHILYGEKGTLTSFDTMTSFAKDIGATLDIMKNGEHWFHTKEQMEFLDKWIMKYY